MNTLGAATATVLVIVILLGSKRAALLGFFAGVLWLTQQQAINVAGFNLYAFRLLELAGLARIIFRQERLVGPLTALDKLVLTLYGYTAVVYLARSGAVGLAYQIGAALDAFVIYFVFRILASGIEDYKWFLRSFSVLLILYAPLVVYETITFNNPFAVIGGAQLISAGDLWIRDGRLRAVGSFGHPSLMGTVGAVFLPLYVSAYISGERRAIILSASIACLALVWASNSGGPATCVAVAIAGWILWPLRRHMSLVRKAVVLSLLVLAVIMKAPIWFILARISSITGGDGFHRAILIDTAFRNLDQWWFAGMPMLETAGWLPYTNNLTGAVDVTNNFLLFGLTAGLGSLLLLIAMLTKAFGSLGAAMEGCRARLNSAEEVLLWGLGVALSVHAFNWFGVTYFDQTSAVWFLHLALVSGLSNKSLPEKSTAEHLVTEE